MGFLVEYSLCSGTNLNDIIKLTIPAQIATASLLCFLVIPHEGPKCAGVVGKCGKH